MSKLQLDKLFADSFDTFKVLDNLTVEETGRNSLPIPNTIMANFKSFNLLARISAL